MNNKIKLLVFTPASPKETEDGIREQLQTQFGDPGSFISVFSRVEDATECMTLFAEEYDGAVFFASVEPEITEKTKIALRGTKEAISLIRKARDCDLPCLLVRPARVPWTVWDVKKGCTADVADGRAVGLRDANFRLVPDWRVIIGTLLEIPQSHRVKVGILQ